MFFLKNLARKGLMAWCWTSIKALPEQMMIIDMYIYYQDWGGYQIYESEYW